MRQLGWIVCGSLVTAMAWGQKRSAEVFKDGVGYDSAKLIESARGLVGIR